MLRAIFYLHALPGPLPPYFQCENGPQATYQANHARIPGNLPDCWISYQRSFSHTSHFNLTDDIRLPFSLGEKRKLRAARGSGITAKNFNARSMIGSSNHVRCTRSDWFESELLLLVKVIFLASSKRGENQFFGNNLRNEVFPETERHMGGQGAI